jgi:hypothetical protein
MIFQQNNEFSKQILIISALILYSKICSLTVRLQVAAHRKPIFAIAEGFHAVHVGFQHSVFFCFGY